MNMIIGFEDLCISCVIGVNPEERLEKQLLFIDLKIKPTSTACIETDLLSDTINYVDLSNLCEKTLKEGKFYLLEKAASEILQKLFEQHPLSWAWIRLKKPQAYPDAKWAVIEMEKSK